MIFLFFTIKLNKFIVLHTYCIFFCIFAGDKVSIKRYERFRIK